MEKCHYVPIYALLILSDGWVEARGGRHLRVSMTQRRGELDGHLGGGHSVTQKWL